MKVAEVMTRGVISIARADSMRKAARRYGYGTVRTEGIGSDAGLV